MIKERIFKLLGKNSKLEPENRTLKCKNNL